MRQLMDYETFERLAAEGAPVPLVDETLADLETPVSALARFADRESVFLLESCEHGEGFGRYSFLGHSPRGIFTVEDGKAFLEDAGGRREVPFVRNPTDALKPLLGRRPAMTEGLPPFFGGAIGFFGYETVNLFESLPAPKKPVDTPTACFLLVDDVLIFDNRRQVLMAVVTVDPAAYPHPRAAYDDGLRRMAALKAPFFVPRRALPAPTPEAEPPRLVSNMGREAFCDAVRSAREAIRAGECIQVVLSQCFSAPCAADPVQLYRALRSVNPSPYTFFFRHRGLTLVGSSPETLVRLEDGRTAVRPIAGTRRRGATEADDRRAADELLNDPKECAEHLMLVDLARNDLGRAAAPGSVHVENFMHIERFSHVMHLVSDVGAMLAEGRDAFDLLAAAFPAGTLSGAPKVRAMELIHALEPDPRGPYGGAVGYFSNTGNMDLAITIRTLMLKQGILSVRAGAGIVSDSDPDREYAETLNKAAALFEAVRLAVRGFDLV